MCLVVLMITSKGSLTFDGLISRARKRTPSPMTKAFDLTEQQVESTYSCSLQQQKLHDVEIVPVGGHYDWRRVWSQSWPVVICLVHTADIAHMYSVVSVK